MTKINIDLRGLNPVPLSHRSTAMVAWITPRVKNWVPGLPASMALKV